ncbi:hypothetical protein LTR50_003839 [Elasticomyces elasticus]|nr:hypothetical protein LTR50_003839 [Elasticomyces elasticus]
MATRGITTFGEPFFTQLDAHKTPCLILSAETDDFDDELLQQWREEGFNVQYVPLAEGGGAYIRRLHDVANGMVGVSEHYAIVAYGDAASAVLEAHIKPSPKLCSIVAYYPSTIPDPTNTRFPMQLQVLVHLAGQQIGVRRNSEILGIQGKRRTVQKRVDPGMGVGGVLNLSYPCYTYEGVEPGFAESDLDEYNTVAADVAWTRSLETVRRGFHMDVNIERVREQHFDHTLKNNDTAKILSNLLPSFRLTNIPTLTGGASQKQLTAFYTTHFTTPPSLRLRLLSRTLGTDRIVDELLATFTHSLPISWLLPGIPPTNEKVEIAIVNIVSVKGGKMASERMYWDQASVLVQIGLLDPSKGVSGAEMRKKGVERLPVVGVEGARAVVEPMSAPSNALLVSRSSKTGNSAGSASGGGEDEEDDEDDEEEGSEDMEESEDDDSEDDEDDDDRDYVHSDAEQVDAGDGAGANFSKR